MPRTIGEGTKLVEKTVVKKVGGRKVTETRLFVRVSYRDGEGRRRQLWRRVENKTDAKEARRALVAVAREKMREDAQASRPREVTFGDLATHYAATSLVPAEYRDGAKVKGRRSLHGMRGHVAWLAAQLGAEAESGDRDDPGFRAWTGGRPLRSITYDDLKTLRERLLATPVRVSEKNPQGDPRKVASVNRRMEVLRNMFTVAAEKGWVERSPFACGPALIDPANEVKRKRLLSYDEEDRLLAECVDRTEGREGKPPRNIRRAWLYAVVVCALDTAMRMGEMLKLRWRDLDAMSGNERRRITIQQMNTKTLQERPSPISRRLHEQFDRLRVETGGSPEDFVFLNPRLSDGYKGVNRAFRNACRDAGVAGLRPHDLRRTAATRLHREGMPIGEVSRILGHTNVTTTYRYIGVDDETTDRAAALFDKIEARRLKARTKGAGKV